MLIDLDKHQLLYYLEGCARGSHLRQGCWHDMIRLYPMMDQRMRDYLYKYAKRDIKPYFDRTFSDGFRPVGADDFDQFLACFNPDNRYSLSVTLYNGNKSGAVGAYFYRGHLYTDDVQYFDEEEINGAKAVLEKVRPKQQEV